MFQERLGFNSTLHTGSGFDHKEEFNCHPNEAGAGAGKVMEPGCCQPFEKDTAFLRYNKYQKYVPIPILTFIFLIYFYTNFYKICFIVINTIRF